MPMERTAGKPTTRRYSPEEKQAAVRMVRSLQAGHSFSSALQMVATEMPDPISREFGKAYEEQNLGLNIKIALENLVERMPILDLKLCVTAVLIQREIGGNLSEVLQNIGHTIRERFRIQGEIRVKSAQARLSGYIISALKAYRAGERSHPSMRGIAASLTDQDMADLAAYYGVAK